MNGRPWHWQPAPFTRCARHQCQRPSALRPLLRRFNIPLITSRRPSASCPRPAGARRHHPPRRQSSITPLPKPPSPNSRHHPQSHGVATRNEQKPSLLIHVAWARRNRALAEGASQHRYKRGANRLRRAEAVMPRVSRYRRAKLEISPRPQGKSR